MERDATALEADLERRLDMSEHPLDEAPDPAEQAERYGAETAVPDWRDRLVCSRCGGREVDMVVTGERR
jgi:hypothetical protein